MSDVTEAIAEYVEIKKAELEFQPHLKNTEFQIVYFPNGGGKIIRYRSENDLDILVEAKTNWDLLCILIPRINRHKQEVKEKTIKLESANEWPTFQEVEAE